MGINHDLIHNLAASNAQNSSEAIVLAVRKLGEKHDLSIAAQMEIADLIAHARYEAVKAALDTARLAMADLLGVKA